MSPCEATGALPGRRTTSRDRLRRAVGLGVLAALTGSCSGLVAPAESAHPASIVGNYTHAPGVAAQLTIERQAEGYVVTLSGGGRTAAGAAAAADCEIRAVGPLVADVLKAEFTALETETFVYTAAHAAREKRTLQISFMPDVAEVTQAATVGYCGLEATFLGTYHRASGRP